MNHDNGISYRVVNGGTSEYLRSGFVAAYKEAFGGPPYFESYSDEEVLQEVWLPHRSDGIIVLALANYSDVVGFGCSKPVRSSSQEIRDFLESSEQQGLLPFPSVNAWYMSELGVLDSYRGRKIGYALTAQRLSAISQLGDTHYVMRTAAEGSNSLHLYERIGSAVIPGRQNIADSNQVQVNHSQSLERVYCYGECLHALSRIEAIVSGK